MRSLRLAVLLLFASLGLTSLAQTPCDWFDHNGDGVIGGNTWLYVLSQYGTAGEMDVDDSGLVDLHDLLAFIPFFQSSCPVAWRDTTESHVLGLALVEHAQHPAALQGLSGELPAGAITYRLYALLADPEDRVLALFGDDETPLLFETEAAFYGFGVGVGETTAVSDYEPAFDSFFPANAFCTWFSTGMEPGDFNGVVGHVSGDPEWAAAQGNTIAMDDAIGGAWFDSSSLPALNDGAVLLGQFTLTEASPFTGTVNLLAATEGGAAIEQVEGMGFASDELTVFGCMEEGALNFAPEATWQLAGSCQFPGDFDGDGELTVEDFMALLAAFGCTDCLVADVDGDGVVSVGDVLLFLTWI